MIILDYLVVIMACLGISMLSAMLGSKDGGFSMNVFLTSFAVSNALMVWIPLYPSFMIFVSILALAGMLFTEGDSYE